MQTQRQKRSRAGLWRFSWVGLCFLLAACHLDMYNQPKYSPYESNRFFEDGSAARPLPPGTVAREQLPLDPEVATGQVDGEYLTSNALPVDEQVLARGQERYNIYCSMCHGVNGDGRGRIANLFNPTPASYYIERLRNAPDGYLFDVITNGKGQMQALSFHVAVSDRWAIIAYIRQLQANPPEGVDTTEVQPTATPTP